LQYVIDISSGSQVGLKAQSEISPRNPYVIGIQITANDWKYIRARCLILLNQISNGLDYYANPINYTPRLDLQTYSEYFSQLNASFSAIDFEFRTTTEKIEKGQMQIKELKLGIDKYRDLIAVLKFQIQSQINEFNTLQADIPKFNSQISVLKELLLHADEAFIIAVNEKIRKEGGGCTFGNALNILGDVINVATGIAGATSNNQSSTYNNVGNGLIRFVKDIDSTEMQELEKDRKLLVVNKLNDVSITGFAALANQYSDSNDNIDISNPNAFIALTPDEFYMFIMKYNDLVETYKLKHVLTEFLKAIDLRNKKIIARDRCYTEVLQKTNEICQYAEDIKKLETAYVDQKSLDKSSVELRIFLEEMNWKVKKDVFRLLYLQKKAFCYWALKEDNEKSLIYSGDLSLTSLAAYNQVISTTKVIEVQEERGKESDPFEMDDVTFISFNYKNFTQAFKQFEKNGLFQFSFDINDAENYFSKLNHCEIFVTDVKIGLYSRSKRDHKPVSLDLIHSGNASFKNQKGEFLNFVHGSLAWAFNLPLNTESGYKHLMSQNTSSPKFALISPFTTWLIRINGNDRNKIANLTSIELKFKGQQRSCK
jgi:hypothetical protein